MNDHDHPVSITHERAAQALLLLNAYVAQQSALTQGARKPTNGHAKDSSPNAHADAPGPCAFVAAPPTRFETVGQEQATEAGSDGVSPPAAVSVASGLPPPAADLLSVGAQAQKVIAECDDEEPLELSAYDAQTVEMHGKFVSAAGSLARRWQENPDHVEQARRKLEAARRVMRGEP